MHSLPAIRSLGEKLAPRLGEIRRHLHAHPELSGQEYQTSAYVARVLSSLGLQVQEGVGKTGVVADLRGGDEPRLAVRTDMDALPIQEGTNLEFSSRYPGVMHACGHDLHTTVGLGVAMVLAQLAPLPGPVRFLFQPAEEIAQGAAWMINDGAMEGVEGIFSLHCWPALPAGTIGIRYGGLTAAADDLEIVILGESGHGARPHEAKDAIWVAAQVITTLQQAISRTHNPLRPVVITIGQIQGGRAGNIIADRVELRGTVRSLDPATRADLPAWLDQVVAGVCGAVGARYDLTYRAGVPTVHNDSRLTQLLESAARQTLGDDQVVVLPEPSLGAEDFAYYLSHAPGAMFRLGVGFKDRPNPPLHHPRFTVDETALVPGIVTLAGAVCNYWST